MTFQARSCTPEIIFRKSHVTTFMSSIDPIYQEYPQGKFITDAMIDAMPGCDS